MLVIACGDGPYDTDRVWIKRMLEHSFNIIVAFLKGFQGERGRDGPRGEPGRPGPAGLPALYLWRNTLEDWAAFRVGLTSLLLSP